MKDGWSDWVLFIAQVVSALGAGAAVWFAAATISTAKKQANKSQEALRRERRIDFELDVLRELAEWNLHNDNVSKAKARFRLLAAMLPADLVPLSRAVVGLESTSAAVEQAQSLLPTERASARSLMRPEIEDEILAAIRRRVMERE